jgi:hypothetical protein
VKMFSPLRPQSILVNIRAVAVVGVCLSLCAPAAPAQSSRDRRDSPSDKQLELRIEKAEELLVEELSEVALELYRKGSRERSLEVLQKLKRMKSDLPGLQEKIDEIQEELLSDNEMEMEFDVSKGWGTPLARVTKGKPFRINVKGEYRMTLSATVPLTGLPTKDAAQDHSAEAPFGALMGVIVTDGKPGKPFPVNESIETTPGKDGELFIRVNVPAAARCMGRLDVKLSGYVQPVSKRR